MSLLDSAKAPTVPHLLRLIIPCTIMPSGTRASFTDHPLHDLITHKLLRHIF